MKKSYELKDTSKMTPFEREAYYLNGDGGIVSGQLTLTIRAHHPLHEIQMGATPVVTSYNFDQAERWPSGVRYTALVTELLKQEFAQDKSFKTNTFAYLEVNRILSTMTLQQKAFVTLFKATPELIVKVRDAGVAIPENVADVYLYAVFVEEGAEHRKPMDHTEHLWVPGVPVGLTGYRIAV